MNVKRQARAEVAEPSSSRVLWPSAETQRIWFQLVQGRAWKSLALVPADGDVLVRALARDFVQLAALAANSRVLFVDATTEPSSGQDPVTRLTNVELLRTAEMSEATFLGDFVPSFATTLLRSDIDTVILALPQLSRRAACIPLARAADVWVLAAAMGTTKFADARETLSLLDRGRLCGGVAIEPSSPSTP